MEEVEEGPSFKLFGAVIVKGHGGGKEEEEAARPSAETGPSGTAVAEEASARAGAAAAAAAAALPCPRCKSMETKFCYFNNYNVNQPRHFCKACHRYWTAGGALRNVPVGAGRRGGRPAHRRGTCAGRQRSGAGLEAPGRVGRGLR